MNIPTTSMSVGMCMRVLDINLSVRAQSKLQCLLSRYMTGDRYYHNLRHIEEGLPEVVRLCNLFCMAPHERLLSLFIWLFHDLDKDSISKSAREFVIYAKDEMGLEPELVRFGYRGIYATDHKHNPHNFIIKTILDIDLKRLASPWDEFCQHSRELKLEKTHLGDERFRTWQIEQLRWFLSRKSIYLTGLFCEHELQARANITRALAELGVPP